MNVKQVQDNNVCVELVVVSTRNIETKYLDTGVPQKFDEMSTLVRAVQEPPDIQSKL